MLEKILNALKAYDVSRCECARKSADRSIEAQYGRTTKCFKKKYCVEIEQHWDNGWAKIMLVEKSTGKTLTGTMITKDQNSLAIDLEIAALFDKLR